MEAKLVKEYGNFYLISDKEIQKGDEYVKLDNRPRMLLLGTTIASAKVSKLSLKNCEAIERGYDLDKLIEENFQGLRACIEDKDIAEFYINLVKTVVTEILGDKKFSEEDMKQYALYIESQRGSTISHKGCISNGNYLKDFQSLQQTEWEVEVLEEEPLVAKERQIHGEHVAFKLIKSTVFPNPLFDADGCLILKRK